NQLITDFLENDVLGSAEQANVDEATVSYTLDAASKSLAAGKLKDKPLIEARICLTLGKTYTYLGELKKGEQHIRRATEIYQQHLGQKHPDTLRAMGRIGWICLKQSRYSEMEQIYTRVLQLGQGVLSLERQVDVKNMLGVAYYALGKNKKAELLYEEILQIVQNNLEGKHSLLPYIKENLAVVYSLQGRYDEAEQIYKELIKADEESEDYDGINHNLYKSLGATYRSQGRYDEAEKFLTEALKASREQLGSEHPQVIGYMRNLALLHIDQERYDDAEKLLLEAVNVSYVKLGDTHPRTLKLIYNLITLYKAWNKPEEAEKWWAKLTQTKAKIE
ncbi:MAG: tetratricopeptide repeat protein, partial [Planctomycetota bacterium]